MKHLNTIFDLSREEIISLLELSREVKKFPGRFQDVLKGQTLAMIFQKPSLRTRVTFETGIFQMGGQAIYLSPNDIQIGKRETTHDIAQNLSRWVDIIMFRTFEHRNVVELSQASKVPVINALSDGYHPCQALADIFTLYERGLAFDKTKIAYIGDGNNVLHSLLNICAQLGIHLAYATPEGYEPNQEVVKKAQEYAANSGARFTATNDPRLAVQEADVVYTDVWASMGQEDEANARKAIFSSFQVNSDLMKKAKRGAYFLHCLPAHRGDEVTDEVIDSLQSIVFDQAENRLHTQKALMLTLLKRR